MTTANKENSHVCPVEMAKGLDNSLRKWCQNPRKILQSFIKEGMTVLDVGCGPGFFTIEIAKLLNNSGKVIAADLQVEMLDRIKQKIAGTELEQLIEIRKCKEETINVTEKVDFALAFYMIHEVPDKNIFFQELKSILNPEGKFLIVEPKFHVSKKAFDSMIEKTQRIGFEVEKGPKIFFSRSVVLKNIEF